MTLPRLAIALAAMLCIQQSLDASRIKDLTSIEGIRENQLYGYGLVVGLAGTGDGDLEYTRQALANAVKSFGLNMDINDVEADNVAAVIITANIPPQIRPGNRIDVTVSSLGDADTLQGGILLQTPLIGADGTVYAVAQGPLIIGGYLQGEGGAGGATVQQNHPTVGKVINGAIIERAIPVMPSHDGTILLSLKEPDISTAVRMADEINKDFPATSQAIDGGSVRVRIPEAYAQQEINFIAAINTIDVAPDVAARVVVNERTGTIVATQNVRISKVAISHGSITIKVASTLEASQPEPFSETGQTVILPSTETEVEEQLGGFEIIDEEPSIERLSSALNALGVSTRELISILHALKASGALRAELIVN